MTDKMKHNLRKGVGLFIAIWTVIVGVAFVVQVWRIYSLGDKPFTTESIGEHFQQIAAPVYIWLAAVVVGGVLWTVFPAPQEKIVPYIELKHTLAKLNRRLPESGEQAKKLQRNRLIAKCVCAVACVGCCVCALVYMLADYKLAAQNGFLAEHGEAERLLRALVWVVAALALSIGTSYFVQDTYKKEIVFAKSEIAANAKKGLKTQKKEENVTLKGILSEKFAFLQSKWVLLGVRIAVAAVAVTFVIVGVCNGGVAAVLFKAINICTQCIGIG